MVIYYFLMLDMIISFFGSISMKKNKNNVKTLITAFVILAAVTFSSVFTALKFQEPVSYSEDVILYDIWESSVITESLSDETVVEETEAAETSVLETAVNTAASSAPRSFDTESDINSDSETNTTILLETETVAVTEQTENKRLININTATAEELQQLNGIGPVIAERIVEYAQTLGFKSIEEIKNVKGIGEKKFEAIKDKITV